MYDFILKDVINSNLSKEFEDIGYDKSYIHKAVEKFQYKNIKIFNLTSAQANIIKQAALTVGADCATNRNCISGEAEISNCILGGNISQIKKIAEKLKLQPFGLKILGEMLENQLISTSHNQTKIVGILNITKDSFSDGGKFYEYENAIKHLDLMITDGADIIDIGAESTKPYSNPIKDSEQIEKLLPVVKYAKSRNITVSIDTRSSKVAEECLKLGADIINDVSGFEYDENMPNIISKYGAKVIIQHSKDTPDKMQDNPEYTNLMDEIYLSLKSKIKIALSKGIKKENIIIDPGIGFGKTREDNFEIIRRIEELYGLGYPVMLGISRKSLLNMPDADNEEKDIYSMALNTLAIQKGVEYIRIHNVKMHKKLVELTSKIVL